MPPLAPGPSGILTSVGPSFLDPDRLIPALGLAGVLVIVFAESGLLIGFFLPGDSLLFTTGLLVADGRLGQPLWLVCALLAVAAIAGDQVGYLFGRRVGPALFRRPDSRLFRRGNVDRAHAFFARYGARSVVLARFVPVVRTFTPIVAGVAGMRYRTFVTYNVVGGVLWACGVTTLGYHLGRIPFVRENVEGILVGVVVLSLVPIGVELLRARARGRRRAGTRSGGAGEGDERRAHGGADRPDGRPPGPGSDGNTSADDGAPPHADGGDGATGPDDGVRGPDH